MVGGRAGDEPAERLGDKEETAERGHCGGDPQCRDAHLDARDDGLAAAFEWRDVETVRSQDLIDLGGDRVEAVLVDAEVDECLDVGNVVGVSAGEPLRELDDRERRLEVASVRVTAATSTSIVGPSSASRDPNWASLAAHSPSRAGETVANVSVSPTSTSKYSVASLLIVTPLGSSESGSAPSSTIGSPTSPAVANVPVANGTTTSGSS